MAIPVAVPGCANGRFRPPGTGEKVWGGGAVGQSRKGVGHQFLSPWQGVGRSIVSNPLGVAILF